MDDVLAYLGVSRAAPDLKLLDELVTAYTRKVPWESASRIAAHAENPVHCPRWPDSFWTQAIQHGTGGTCFESNYAFFMLLKSLSYEGYLTINNMGETVGCHTAIVILLDGEKWLVDVGIPLYVPIPVKAGEVTRRSSAFMDYTIRSLGNNRYDIERAPHPNPIVFTLIDSPIPEQDYRTATTNDYGECGLFLNRVIINKIVDETMWRFDSDAKPYHLESFPDGQRIDTPITGDVAREVAAHFGVNEAIVRRALAEVDG